MKLTKLVLEKFKKVDKVEIDLSLSPLNVLVGGNNSGKSSVLQGIHFSIIAAIASREAGKNTYTQDSLLFCPARNFEDLRHGEGYLNQSNFGHLKLFFELPDDGAVQYLIRIYRGRNEGNVGCERRGNIKVGGAITNSESLFSIYVPGLAGIPQSEQFRTESVVRRGVASGDANLYLRNVLWLINESGKLDALTKRMRALFPKFEIWISFKPSRDVFIDVSISTTGPSGRRCPVELVGTGVLQALQIFSYVTLFAPSILLLDEPDAHLHPDNQALLANALQYITSETSTHVLMSTHSRHMVDALHQDANFVWLKDGKVSREGVNLDRLPLLLDIGALDSFDRLMAGQTKWVFLTEDSDASMLETLAEISGFPRKDTLFFSYKTSSNLEPAKILAEFILEISPQTVVIIHRDRDFMTTDEVDKVCARIAECGAVPFITEPSDVEGYFIAPEHIAAVTEKAPADVVAWLDDIASTEHTQLQHEFTRKRDAVKFLLYKKDADKCPDTLTLIGNTIPLSPDKRRGKFMLKKVRGGLADFIGTDVDLLVPSAFLKSPVLESIRKSKP